MKEIRGDIEKSIVSLSNFSIAMALPVRICVIRQFLKNRNEATREMLYDIPYNKLKINKHVNELKYLGILKTKKIEKKYYFMLMKIFLLACQIIFWIYSLT